MLLRKALILVCFISVLVLTGCVDADKINIRFDLNPSLQGTLTLEFLGIHADGKPEEQKKEMEQFYAKKYLEDAANFEHEWSIKNARTEFRNKTELKCDGKITGEIENVIKSLALLVSERGSTYEIKRDANRFHFTTRGGWTDKDSEISLFIRYEGKILENNAQTYNEDSHLMEWNLGKLDPSGIHFILEVPEE